MTKYIFMCLIFSIHKFLNPKTSISSPSAMIRANTGKRAPGQLWDSVVNIILIEGNNLISMDDNGKLQFFYLFFWST